MALAQLACGPGVLIVELSAGPEIDHVETITDVLGEIAREAATVDIGLCLVVGDEYLSGVTRVLTHAGMNELFEIFLTVAAALDSDA
jgi:hypothetical protein